MKTIMSRTDAENIIDFIWNTLDREFDRYTDSVICTLSWTEGMRKMNPEMYDLMERLREQLDEDNL